MARYNGATGAFIDTFVPPGPGSTALGFGNDGNLYIAGFTNNGGSVRRYDGTTGTFIDTFVAPTFQLTATTGILFTPEPASLSAAGGALILLTRRGKKRSRVRSTPADPASTAISID